MEAIFADYRDSVLLRYVGQFRIFALDKGGIARIASNHDSFCACERLGHRRIESVLDEDLFLLMAFERRWRFLGRWVNQVNHLKFDLFILKLSDIALAFTHPLEERVKCDKDHSDVVG